MSLTNAPVAGAVAFYDTPIMVFFAIFISAR
jgi:hypothetical protein